MRFSDKVVLISGSGAGMGRPVAPAFVRANLSINGGVPLGGCCRHTT